jgi:hypothetical protein
MSTKVFKSPELDACKEPRRLNQLLLLLHDRTIERRNESPRPTNGGNGPKGLGRSFLRKTQSCLQLAKNRVEQVMLVTKEYMKLLTAPIAGGKPNKQHIHNDDAVN